MKPAAIKYKYALCEDGSFIDIESVTPSERKDFVCLGCGGVVRPILGEIRRKHFRHKTSHDCPTETYLHKMGKLLFEKKYRECLKNKTPYLINYKAPVSCDHCKHGQCDVAPEWQKFNLIPAFDSISVETRDGSLIPDLMLHAKSDHKIYIEIAVTHTCSNEKLKSGEKIIEFSIQHEDDLKIFNRADLYTSFETVKFYNFNPKPLLKKLPKLCKKFVTYFVVFPNGKCAIKNDKIFDFDTFCENNTSLYIIKVPQSSFSIFVEEAEKAYHKGIKVKNCYLCRYHGTSNLQRLGRKIKDESQKIFCRSLQDFKTSNSAAECAKYYPDPKKFESKLQQPEYPVTYSQPALPNSQRKIQAAERERQQRIAESKYRAAKNRADIAIPPEYVTCSTCGEYTNVWTSYNPAICTKCVNASHQQPHQEPKTQPDASKIPPALLKSAAAEYFCNVIEFLYIGTGRKMSSLQACKVKTTYNSVEEWYASLSSEARENIIKHLNKQLD